VNPDGDDKEDWVFSTRELVTRGLAAFFVGVIVGELLILAAVAFGGCW